jgi:glycosyltransferase involved in cell wall biosynthesis
VPVGTREHHLVLVCEYPPSTNLGGGLVLRRLLDRFPGALTIVANRTTAGRTGLDVGRVKPTRTVLPRPWQARPRGLRRLVHELNLLRIPVLAASIRRVARGGTILAVPSAGVLGSELFVAAWMACWRGGPRLVVYELDEWEATVGRWGGSRSLLARALHRRVLRAAAAVWAVGPQMAEYLQARSGREVEVLPGLVELEDYAQARESRLVAAPTPIRVVVLGAVYGPQADAIADVARAVERCRVPAELVLYTHATREQLAALGIAGRSLVVEPYAPQAQLPAILAGATVLLLPYSFREDMRKIVSTSLPTKLAEYLASGTPVLVHAPAYATTARLGRAEGWAAVTGSRDVDELARTVERLATDDDYRAELSARALAVARERHDSRAFVPRFYASLGEPGLSAPG